MLKLSIVAALFLASTAAAFPGFTSERLAPIYSSAEAEAVPDSYFVVFKDGVNLKTQANWVQSLHERDVKENGIWDEFLSGIKHVYDMGSFQGLAGRFRPEVLDEIRRNPDVDYIERDQIVYASDIQHRATWGLARISHRKGLTLSTFNKYIHDPRGGEGITVYIIDTGVHIDHKDFEGRASWGKTIPQNDPDQDDNGHGTHCAGTVGSLTYGVAKKAEIVAVKVLRSNGSGTMTDVVAGVDYAQTQHLKALEKKGKKYKGSVANMSLGGGKSRALDSAVNNAVASGLHFAVAAGNDNRDACDYSPAGAERAITVGASSLDDSRAYFSNKGKCVDVFAPGKDITSTWIGGNTRRTISGTSMASPHVAGLIAYYLSLAPDNESQYYSGPISPKEMKEVIKARATKDVLTDIPSDTPNLLIYNNATPDKYYAW